MSSVCGHVYRLYECLFYVEGSVSAFDSIGVGRGGGGGGGGGGQGGRPPNNSSGGPSYPLAPPNNPPTFSFNFYVKQEKITNVPS